MLGGAAAKVTTVEEISSPSAVASRGEAESRDRLVALVDTENRFPWAGSGGEHRSLQIVELLQRIGLEVRQQRSEARTMFLERHLRGFALHSLQGYPIHRPAGERIPIRGRQAMSNLGHFAKRYVVSLSAPPRPRVFLWEHSNNTVGAFLAAKAGCAVVAVPQNIYTLERGFKDSWFGRRGLAALDRELKFIRGCVAVFCISREEQWFLRIQGIPAEHLPYYPPAEVEEFLLDVRRLRQPAVPRRFLLLGVAPHGDSIREVVWFVSSSRGFEGLRVDVAGHGTESLKPAAASPNVVVHGAVTQQQLRDLLMTTSAAIVHQRASTGALTRIPELLLAGVPVIANAGASRSTWTLEGMLRYDSMEELEGLVQGPMPTVPKLERPTAAEARFRDVLEHQLGRHPMIGSGAR